MWGVNETNESKVTSEVWLEQLWDDGSTFTETRNTGEATNGAGRVLMKVPQGTFETVVVAPVPLLHGCCPPSLSGIYCENFSNCHGGENAQSAFSIIKLILPSLSLFIKRAFPSKIKLTLANAYYTKSLHYIVPFKHKSPPLWNGGWTIVHICFQHHIQWFCIRRLKLAVRSTNTMEIPNATYKDLSPPPAPEPVV